MGWLQNRRRRKLLETPFSEAWEEILAQNVAHAASLDPDEGRRLREFIQIFIAGRGEPTFLDHYGATNEAEFFAVATEFFFDRPQAMERHEPELYGVLRDFYRQDPAQR